MTIRFAHAGSGKCVHYLQHQRCKNNLCRCKFSSVWRLVQAIQASREGGSSWAPRCDAAIWEIRRHMETNGIRVRSQRTVRGNKDDGQRAIWTHVNAHVFRYTSILEKKCYTSYRLHKKRRKMTAAWLKNFNCKKKRHKLCIHSMLPNT